MGAEHVVNLRERLEERGVSALVCAQSKYSKFGRNFQVYFYEAHGSTPLHV